MEPRHFYLEWPSTFQDQDTLIERSVTLIEHSSIQIKQLTIQNYQISQAANFKNIPMGACLQILTQNTKYVQTVTILLSPLNKRFQATLLVVSVDSAQLKTCRKETVTDVSFASLHPLNLRQIKWLPHP